MTAKNFAISYLIGLGIIGIFLGTLYLISNTYIALEKAIGSDGMVTLGSFTFAFFMTLMFGFIIYDVAFGGEEK